MHIRRFFRVHDSGGIIFGDGWNEEQHLAKVKGWKDSDENIFAERHEIWEDLRDMNEDDIFVYHGHGIARLNEDDECYPAGESLGIQGYDTFGFPDDILHGEIATFIGDKAPGIVIISGCASFMDPLKSTFMSKGTKLYIGWLTPMKELAVRAPIHAFIKDIVNGMTIQAAKTHADALIPELFQNLRLLNGCPPLELSIECTGTLNQTIYQLLGLKAPATH